MGVSKTSHPEIRNDEMLLLNGTISDYKRCTFVTKRLGKQVQNESGQLLQNAWNPRSGFPIFPIFVEKWEKEFREKIKKEEDKQ